MNIFKKIFGKKSKNGNKMAPPIPYKQNDFSVIETYETDGVTYTLGDRVICRSNEPDPLLIGEIVEFWDNDGKWSDCIPQVRSESDGLIYGIMGIIKPYSEGLMNELSGLRPLEQWNYFVDEPYKYSEEDIIRKEKSYKARQKWKETA